MSNDANLIELARHYLDVEQPQRALEVLNQIQGPDLTGFEYWELRGRALYNLRRYEEANRVVEAGLSRDPESVELLYLHCCCQNMLGNPAEAEKSILAALRLMPHEPVFLTCYAILVARAEQFDKAKMLLTEASRIAPDHPEVLEGWATLAYFCGDDKLAGKFSKKILEEDPESLRGHYLHGFYLQSRGDYRRATRHHQTAVQLNPKDRIYAEAARHSRQMASPLLWPLWPFIHFGSGTVWIAAIVIISTLRVAGYKDIAAIFALTYIFLCIYSWIVPRLLR
ncbi:MAG TPA: tetratricopeptide repeat protein [Armatimonadota bacterium]|jgi:tetratricopeptide (TPR) repeat protein|nr:tetratricopeptide repeat protein [Armatimonadota bacterium]HPP73863.1 tetratricopeptide repeat protein [Armatimonadota bacterium]